MDETTRSSNNNNNCSNNGNSSFLFNDQLFWHDQASNFRNWVTSMQRKLRRPRRVSPPTGIALVIIFTSSCLWDLGSGLSLHFCNLLAVKGFKVMSPTLPCLVQSVHLALDVSPFWSSQLDKTFIFPSLNSGIVVIWYRCNFIIITN